MRNINIPTIDVSHHQKEFRVTLLNSRKSAILGLFFLILPLLFLSGVILKHYMHIEFGLLTSVYHWIGTMDEKYGDASILNWIIRFLLLGGPLIAIGVNLIAVTYIRYEAPSKELLLSFKLKWLNWTIIAVCSVAFIIFFSYMIVENMN